MSDTPPKGRNQHGSGAFDDAQIAAIVARLRTGETQASVARSLGVTKNTIAGLWHRNGEPQLKAPAKTTMAERLDALHQKLDAVLAATVGVGRIPEPERKPR
jgi:transcriptional regulator with XRE-family HTH domain